MREDVIQVLGPRQQRPKLEDDHALSVGTELTGPRFSGLDAGHVGMRPDHDVLTLHGLAGRRGRSDRSRQKRRDCDGSELDQTEVSKVTGESMGGQDIGAAFADEHDLGILDIRETD